VEASLSALDLLVERPVAGGRMLARHDGRVVLVAGAIPGERVRARVERVSRAVVWAETIEVLEPSADRRPPVCDQACGGSLYAHIQYERQRTLKAEVIADAFRRIGKIELPQPPDVAGSPEQGYRLRARVHVRKGRAGFYREGSHELCDAAATHQLHAEAIPAVVSVLSSMRGRLAACDGVVIAENVRATERVLHLLAREGARLDDLRPRLTDLAQVTGVTTTGPAGVVALFSARLRRSIPR
jgi:23S rRNA (uracil1939-C5)-methyltransferase